MVIQRALRQSRAGFVVVDALAVAAALVLALLMRHGQLAGVVEPYLAAIPYVVVIFVLSFRYAGAYQHLRGGVREAVRIAVGVAIGTAITLALSFFYRGFSYSRLTVVFFFGLAIVLPLHLRYLYRTSLQLLVGQGQWVKRVLVVGESPEVGLVLEELVSIKSDYLPIGVLSRRGDERRKDFGHVQVPVLGAISDSDRVIADAQPDLVIVADRNVTEGDETRIIDACTKANIHWKVLPRTGAPADQELALAVVGGVPLLGSKGNNITGFNYLLKRVMDAILCLVLLAVLSPLMLTVAALIKIFSKGPVLFVQERIGYRGRPFRFYKFRTMRMTNDDSIHREYVAQWINNNQNAKIDDNGTVVHKITKDPRVIPVVGGFIRKYSIDELPQLLNVIKGDMSLVGPRPCLGYEVDLYQRWHKMRFDALPGITGLWQVSGRNRLTFDQMVGLDIRYLQNWSLPLDLSIIARTPYVILFDKAY